MSEAGERNAAVPRVVASVDAVIAPAGAATASTARTVRERRVAQRRTRARGGEEGNTARCSAAIRQSLRAPVRGRTPCQLSPVANRETFMRSAGIRVFGGRGEARYGGMRPLRILLCAALAVLLAIPAAASAAKNPYSAAGVCGLGYRVIDRHRLYATNPSNGNRVLLATVVLTYNSAQGTNCAVTMKRYRVGKAAPVFGDHLGVSLAARPLGPGHRRRRLRGVQVLRRPGLRAGAQPLRAVGGRRDAPPARQLRAARLLQLGVQEQVRALRLTRRPHRSARSVGPGGASRRGGVRPRRGSSGRRRRSRTTRVAPSENVAGAASAGRAAGRRRA